MGIADAQPILRDRRAPVGWVERRGWASNTYYIRNKKLNYATRRGLKSLVPYQPTLVTFCAKTPSDHSRNDGCLLEPLGCGGGSATGFGQVVAIRACDALDHPDMSRSRRSCRDSRSGENIPDSEQLSPADASDVDPGILQGMQQSIVAWLEEVDPLDGLAVHLARPGQAAEGADTGGEVVQRREVSEIAPVAAKSISRRSIRL